MRGAYRNVPFWLWLLASEVVLVVLAIARIRSGVGGPFTRVPIAAALWIGVSLIVDLVLRGFRAPAAYRARTFWLLAALFLAWNVYRVDQWRLGSVGEILALITLTALIFDAGTRALGGSGRYGHRGAVTALTFGAGNRALGHWHGIAAVLLGALAAARINGEIYGLTTGLLLIGAVAFAVLFASDRLSFWLKVERDTQASLRLMWSAAFLLIVLLEFVLRFGLGQRVTYMEANNGGTYVSLRYSAVPTALSVYRSNEEVRHVKTEFVHSRQANSLGLAEQEIGARTDSQEYRIVALGDSFTEGVGAPYESTWVKAMEEALAARLPHRKLLAINAGHAGSDVMFEYRLLEDKLLSLDPQLVIVALNMSDMNDVAMRGGMERFLPDGLVRPIAVPWWEWLYATSYIARHFIHDALGYNWSFTKTSDEPAVQREALGKIRDALAAFAALADRRGFTFLLVLHPALHEALTGVHPSPFDELVPALSKIPRLHFVDLLNYFRDRAGLTAANATEFYWPIDLHHTPKGYGVMGHAIAEAVLERGLIR